ncbi:MAG: hypothetical protein Q8P41_19585 [Pseudomonadota bacterium]|nr:hypothetical protein [Pseudomonadota bacterium]
MPYVPVVTVNTVETCLGTDRVVAPAGDVVTGGAWIVDGGMGAVPDALWAEAELVSYEVTAGQASLVSADIRARPASALGTGDAGPRLRIKRVNLGDAEVTASRGVRGTSACADVDNVDWTGGAGLRVEAAALGTSDPGTASVVLVDANPWLGALVLLAPGDTAEVRELRRDGRMIRESLTVQRAGGGIALRRDGDRSRVCHVDVAPAPIVSWVVEPGVEPGVRAEFPGIEQGEASP